MCGNNNKILRSITLKRKRKRKIQSADCSVCYTRPPGPLPAHTVISTCLIEELSPCLCLVAANNASTQRIISSPAHSSVTVSPCSWYSVCLVGGLSVYIALCHFILEPTVPRPWRVQLYLPLEVQQIVIALCYAGSSRLGNKTRSEATKTCSCTSCRLLKRRATNL